MRSPIHILAAVAAMAVLALSSCSQSDTFTLRGQLPNQQADTLLVFYQLPDYSLDTLIVDADGQFTYTIHPDTLTLFTLLWDDHSLPVFADKGQEARLIVDEGQPFIDGPGDNARWMQICQHLATLQDGTPHRLRAAVDSIIKADPYSFANLPLIDRYYARDTLPEYTHLSTLLDGLSGIVRDTPYLLDLQDKLEGKGSLKPRRMVSNISATDRNGQSVSWTTLRGHYVLLSFWASWHPESVAAQDSLVPVLQALRKDDFAVVSVSLDMNRDAWIAAVAKRDTTQWKQVCDFRGWEGTLVQQQGVTRIPHTLLLSPDKRLVDEDLSSQQIIDKVKELVAKDKEREKAERERNRRNNK